MIATQFRKIAFRDTYIEKAVFLTALTKYSHTISKRLLYEHSLRIPVRIAVIMFIPSTIVSGR